MPVEWHCYARHPYTCAGRLCRAAFPCGRVGVEQWHDRFVGERPITRLGCALFFVKTTRRRRTAGPIWTSSPPSFASERASKVKGAACVTGSAALTRQNARRRMNARLDDEVCARAPTRWGTAVFRRCFSMGSSRRVAAGRRCANPPRRRAVSAVAVSEPARLPALLLCWRNLPSSPNLWCGDTPEGIFGLSARERRRMISASFLESLRW